MSTHISWFNFQSSLNPFQHQQESSQFILKNNQNSISYLAKYPPLQKQQQSRSLFNIHALLDNLLGRSQTLLNKEEALNLQFLNGFNSQPIQNEQESESKSQIQQSSKQMVQLEAKKGLKNLAKLLIRTLKRKKFDSSKYLTEQIEQKLMKGKKISKNQFARESKNIRRRTYDALNVMMAANVLGPDLGFIRRVNSSSFTKKCALIIGQKNQIETKIALTEQKIQKKKQFLIELNRKKQAIRWWITQKKKQRDTINKIKLQQTEINDKKLTKIHTIINSGMIALPVVIIGENYIKEQNNFELRRQSLVQLNYKHNKIKLFSDIDCFQLLRNQYQNERNNLFNTENKKNVQKVIDKIQLPIENTQLNTNDLKFQNVD